MKTPDTRTEWLRHVRPESVRGVFDHLPGVMFFAKDLEGRFTMANLAFAQRCGCKDEASLLGKTDSDVFPPELVAAFHSLVGMAAVLVAVSYAVFLTPDVADKDARFLANRYYDWQVQAWLQGRLDLPIPLAPEFLALPDHA